ncbi:uncharacterized protein RCH25_018035 [Pelodytes ibericus]
MVPDKPEVSIECVENTQNNDQVTDNSFFLSYGDITYSTPPYMSIREDHGPIRIYRPVRQRVFLDMKKKFTSNDTSYVTFEEDSKIDVNGQFKRKHNLKSSIRDRQQKWLVYANDRLLAKQLQSANMREKASFNISFYAPIVETKQPITLKIEGSNKYLSYDSGNFKLESVSEASLETINDSNKRFLFFENDTDNVHLSLEPAMAPQSFLSTSAQNGSPVTVAPGPINTRETNFIFDAVLFGSFLQVGNKRLSLQPLRGGSCSMAAPGCLQGISKSCLVIFSIEQLLPYDPGMWLHQPGGASPHRSAVTLHQALCLHIYIVTPEYQLGRSESHVTWTPSDTLHLHKS